MEKYEKPIVIVNNELAEGVYATGSGAANNAPGCDSQYMAGTWQGPDNSAWNGKTRGYKQQFGCHGCPAYTGSACGLTTHYVDANYAASYDVDNGNRMPSWERKGYGPDDPVTDWGM